MFRAIKYFYQRGRRGYSDRDLWDLSCYLSDMLSRALSDLKKNKHGYPPELTEKKWDRILTDMQSGFLAQLALMDINTVTDSKEYTKELTAKMNKGLKLFAKHYMDLWD